MNDAPQKPVDPRRMVKSTLNGQHSFATSDGTKVHIHSRGNKYLARGRYQGRRYGDTLGQDPSKAFSKLCRILTEIGDGRYIPPSETRTRAIKTTVPQRLSFTELCGLYLDDVRKVDGQQTMETYRSKLMHVIRMTETPAFRTKWPYVTTMNCDCALALKTQLFSVVTTRNGKPGGNPKPFSPRQIYNVLDTTRSVINWALKPTVRKLPFDYPNPFTKDIVGNRPGKDPLRKQLLPLDVRISIIRRLDCWQLATIGLTATLPLRPEDLEGILISDIDLVALKIFLGTRFNGADFNKGRQNVFMPIPEELIPVLKSVH